MEKWMIHSAVTVIQESRILDNLGRTATKDTELCQFAAEFPRSKGGLLVPESAFRKAFREMEELCLAKARAAGLIR